MNIKIDSEILCRDHDFMNYEEEVEIFNIIEKCYNHTSVHWLMHKAFEFGYVYGLRAKRARRKRGAVNED